MSDREHITAPEPCCLELRCKSMTYRVDERPGMVHPSDLMTYWCALTGTDDGPDRELVDHRRCQSPRGCFRGMGDLS